MLIKAGCAIDAKMEDGMDLATAAKGDPDCLALVKFALERRFECLKILIEAGADVDARGLQRATLAMLAAARGRRDCLAELISAGCDIEAASFSGKTALMWAAQLGKNDCLRLLVEKGAALDARANDGLTALALAVAGRRRGCVEILLAANCGLEADLETMAPGEGILRLFQEERARREGREIDAAAGSGSMRARPKAL